MARQEVLILCMSIITAVLGSHMQGGTMSFRTREKLSNGWMVDFKYKSSFIDKYYGYLYWSCLSGYCGYDLQHLTTPIENRTSYPSTWYQTEGYIKKRINSDKPFQLWEYSCCWVYNINYEGGWQLLTAVDLGIRSDTKKPNNSPVTNIIPIIRIPQNCPGAIWLLAHDPDGDLVRCRNGYKYAECSFCTWYFPIDYNQCIISVPTGNRPGLYVMELVLEDFPNEDIHLTYNDGTVSHKFRPLQALDRRARSRSEYWHPYDTTLNTYDTEMLTDVEATDFVTKSTEHSITHELFETETMGQATEPRERTSEAASYLYTTEKITVITEYPTTEFPYRTTLYTYDTGMVTEGKATDFVTKSTEHSITQELFETETTGQASETREKTSEAASHLYTTEKTTVIAASDYQTMEFPYDIEPLSKIPLQFLVEVTNPAPSCTLGRYRPEFIAPTPHIREKLVAHVDKTFQLHLAARAAYESITDFKVSGPAGMTKSLLGRPDFNTRTITVEWTPKEDNVGEHVPVCFVAETTSGFQSELRCVIIVVEPWKIDLLCHENTMTIIVFKSWDNALHHNQFRLNDPKCLVSSNSTHLVASVGYNSCGTETEETEENIVFKNEIASYDNISVVITRQDGVSIPFNCSFPKKSRISASFHVKRKTYVYTEAGFGNFTYTFQFFTDNRFVDLRQNTLKVQLKELLYMEIQVLSSVPNIKLFVESCRATPHDNPSDSVFYSIIENGCEKDATLVDYPGPSNTYRFSMEAFAFIGDYEEVYISCAVILCKAEASNTRCTQGCITSSSGNHRRRRSLVSESQQHFISQGPIQMKDETPYETGVKKTSAVNVNTLVIALSVIATVALISLTLNIYMRGTRTADYKRLNTQDF